MTEMRSLEVLVISAHDLKDVKRVGKMHTYVVAWVDPRKKFSTHEDNKGGTSPVWNQKLFIPVEQRLLDQAMGVLMLEIYSHGFLKTTQVGSAQVPMSDISSKASGQRLEYPVMRPSGRLQGTIIVSLTLGEKIINAPMHAPVTAAPYIPPPQQGLSGGGAPVAGYPGYASSYPAPYPAAYQYPPANAYGQYYPPPAGGYPPAYYAQPPPQGRNRLNGGGLAGGAGAGLLGGLLGGFLLGDLIGSASDWGDGGGDWGDGGGFDGGFF